MNKYQTWNSETSEKSELVKHTSLAAAVVWVETQIALHPRDNDDEGWRLQEVTGGAEMTLAESRRQIS